MRPESFLLPVEAGHVALFLRAIGSETPDLARLTPGLVVPALTFVQTADHFDPDFERRPRWGKPWLGSSSQPSGVPAGSDRHQGLFHTDQLFTYHRHPRVGDILRVERSTPRSWTKQGRRGGALEFIERVTEFYDADGHPVVSATWRDVRTERHHAEVSKAQNADPQPRAAETPVGAARVVLAEGITRTQLVMYAGVAGDFHPLHHDEPYVQHLGYPAVFVPGMLTMAMVGRALSASTEPSRVREFGGRFHAQLWPGDSLYAYVTQGEDPHRVEITARNQHDQKIFSAHAVTSG